MKNEKPLIAVVDYGMGNLRSVAKAIELVGAKVVVSNKQKELLASNGIVFPGVGAFNAALVNLKKTGLLSCLHDCISSSKPFLGLCLGFQLLFDHSQEGSGKGLSIIHGNVKAFNFKNSKLKVPHMGWNTVSINKENKFSKEMFKGIKNNSYFYFVHSYYCVPKSYDVVAAKTSYGIDFCSAVAKGNYWASQFHPEKSGANGLKLLANFVDKVKKCS